MRKTLQEIAKLKGKTLLIESSSLSVKEQNIEIIEEKDVKDNKLTESNDGVVYKCRGILKNVPVSRYDHKNNNGRIYPKSLFEKIFRENTANGTVALLGHPEQDGEPGSIAGVFHNFKVCEDKICRADIYLVGDGGSLMLESIQAGSKMAGLSSCGYGELMGENNMVNPDTFELERLGDFVLSPSQSVFADISNIDESSLTESTTPITETLQPIISNPTNKINYNKEVKTMPTKIEEANLRNQISDRIRQAQKGENLVESIQSLRNIVIPEGFENLNEKIDTTIDNLEVKLNSQKDNTDKQILEQTEKLTVIDKENKELKEKLNKAQKVLELSEDTEFNESIDKLQEKIKISKQKSVMQERKINDLITDRKAMGSDLRCYTEDTNLRDYDIKCLVEDTKFRNYDLRCLVEDTKKMTHDIKCFTEDKGKMDKDIKILLEKLKLAEKTIKLYEKELENSGFEFEDDANEEDENGVEPEENNEDEFDDTGIKKYQFTADLEVDTDTGEVDVDNAEIEEPGEDEGEEFGDEDEDENGEDNFGDEDEGGEEFNFGESTKKKKKVRPKLKESVRKPINKQRLSEKNQITLIYEKFAKDMPALTEFKEQIMKSKSPLEAVRKINQIKTNKDELVEAKNTVDKIKMRRPKWLEGRR